MLATDEKTIAFTRGVPPLEAIPVRELAGHAAAVLDERPEVAFQYAPLGGYLGDPELREALAAFHPGTDPAGVFVGNGSLQVLDLLAAELLKDGPAPVLVEAPTYDRAIGIIQRHGGEPIGVPMEADGIDLEALERLLAARRPAFLYLIPDFQNPSGVTLGEDKRWALVDLAARQGLTIVEDIPYRELRYRGSAPPRLGEIAGDAPVITVGSLTKVLAPGLRVGYAIGSPELAAALARRAEATYLSPTPLAQAVAARAMAAGLARSNVERIRAIFAPRLDGAVAAARRVFGEALISEPDGGYFLGLRLSGRVDEPALLAAARAEGVVLASGQAFLPPSHRTSGAAFLRLPFHALDPADFADGAARLGSVLGGLGALDS